MSGFDRLREVAAKATPGPWFVDDTYGTVTAEPYRSARAAYNRDRFSDNDDCWVIPESMDSGVNGSNLDYIAAASPDVLLGLLDRLEAAEAVVARVRALAEEWEALLGGYIDPSDRSMGYAYATRRHAERLRTALAGEGNADSAPEAARNGARSEERPERDQLRQGRDDEGRSGARDGSGL